MAVNGNFHSRPAIKHSYVIILELHTKHNQGSARNFRLYGRSRVMKEKELSDSKLKEICH